MVLLLWVLPAHSQRGGDWFSGDSKYRVTGSVAYASRSGLILMPESGDETPLIHVGKLSTAGQIRIQGIFEVFAAAEELAESPYLNSSYQLHELRSLLRKLGVTTGLSNRMAGDLYVHGKRVVADRSHLDLLGRCWVELNGVQYMVADVSELNFGVKRLVIEDHDGALRTIPANFKRIRILPKEWDKPTISFRRSNTPFESRRGIPARFTVAPKYRWKYRLDFEPVDAVWMDEASARARERIRTAESAFAEAERLENVSRAKWNLHQGDVFAEESSKDTVTNWSQAISHYDAAIKDSPNLSDAFLARGFARMMTNDQGRALIDFRRANELGWMKSSVARPSMELRARIYSRLASSFDIQDERQDGAAIQIYDAAVAEASELASYSIRSYPAEPVRGPIKNWLAQRNLDFGESRSKSVLAEIKRQAAHDLHSRAKVRIESVKSIHSTLRDALSPHYIGRLDFWKNRSEEELDAGIAALAGAIESTDEEVELVAIAGKLSEHANQYRPDNTISPFISATSAEAVARKLDAEHQGNMIETTRYAMIAKRYELRAIQAEGGLNEISEEFYYRNTNPEPYWKGWTEDQFVAGINRIESAILDVESAASNLTNAIRTIKQSVLPINPVLSDDALYREELSRLEKRQVISSTAGAQIKTTLGAMQAEYYSSLAANVINAMNLRVDYFDKGVDYASWTEFEFQRAIDELTSSHSPANRAYGLLEDAVSRVRTVVLPMNPKKKNDERDYQAALKRYESFQAQVQRVWQKSTETLGRLESLFVLHLLKDESNGKSNYFKALKFAGLASQHNPNPKSVEERNPVSERRQKSDNVAFYIREAKRHIEGGMFIDAFKSLDLASRYSQGLQDEQSVRTKIREISSEAASAYVKLTPAYMAIP